MDKTRGDFSKFLVLAMLGVGLLGNFAPSIVLADNPNEHSSYHSLTGGWNRTIGNIGRHWTTYTQRYGTGQLYASIKLSGYQRQSNLGNYKTASVTSSRRVDLKHPHIHSGGQTN